jgi:hypothetical protein
MDFPFRIGTRGYNLHLQEARGIPRGIGEEVSKGKKHHPRKNRKAKTENKGKHVRTFRHLGVS